MTIGFVGLSHLGLVSSVCWASLGWQVVGVDTNTSAVSQGCLRTREPRLAALFNDNRERISFTSDFSALADCEIVFIALDVETDRDDRLILTRLNKLIARAIPCLTSGVVLIVTSQVPVGFTRQLWQTIRTARPDLSFELYYWAETLVIGNAVERCLKPERIVLGGEGASLDAILSIFSCPVLRMSYESAEMTKAAVNLYLSVSVTFANTLAGLCEATGASMREIVPALRLDRRIGQHAYIRPSLGIAGGHLERDLVQLSRLCRGFDLIDYVLGYNARRYRWVYEHIGAAQTVAVWGLAYKKNTQSTKNSFAVRILRDLVGKTELYVYDPVASIPTDLRGKVVTRCDRFDALDGADCLLVLTDWDEFADTDFAVVASKMRGRVIVDCVGVMDRDAAERHGFYFVSIGDS